MYIVLQSKNLPAAAVMLFIDFNKEFDSFDRGILWKILRVYGTPENILNLIRNILYDGTLARVVTEDGLTAAFLILAGVMEGGTLAPFLFVIAIKL